MSKFIDRLHKVSQGDAHHMGFAGIQSNVPKNPVLAIMVTIPGPESDLVRVAVQSGADAVLIQVGSLDGASGRLEKVAEPAGDVPWGVMLEAAVPDDIRHLSSLGADFLALHTETAPSAILRYDDMGRLAIIDPYLDDSLLRTLDRLAIDAVLVELEQGNEEFLTVREVMACRRAIELVRKPVILRISHKLSSEDLANIRDLGIEGILVDLSGKSPETELSRLRRSIDELPPRRKQREGVNVFLPRGEAVKAEESEDDEQ